MLRFEFEFRTFLWFCYITFVHMENRVCLSHGVQVAHATQQAVMRIVAVVGDLVPRTGDGQAQLRYSVAGRSGSQVMSCVVCIVHMETRSMGFLVEPQNQGRRFPGLGLKISSSDLVIWASKLPRWFLGLGLKIKQATVYRLRHKTDGRIIRCRARVVVWWFASLGSKSC
jgi:hypothetical protein